MIFFEYKKGVKKVKNILGIVVSFVFIGIVIASAKLVEKAGKEAGRKYIHIILCNWWFIAMYFFDNAIWATIVPFLFVIINYLSYQKDIIKIMEREEGKKDGMGTVYYAISLLILSILCFSGIMDPKIGLVGILIMGYGDGFAAVIGKKIKSKEYKIGKNTIKTIAGSFTMLLFSFIILAIFLAPTPFWYIKAIVASILLTIVEAISIKGTDNITVPLLASGIMYLFIAI